VLVEPSADLRAIFGQLGGVVQVHSPLPPIERWSSSAR
jgi:hypothetical protein